MNNESLFRRIKKLVSTERRIGVEILECLHEIERRKAYAELKYDGLYTFCVKELGFTESQTYQRIQAMHALKEVPELKPMIESGSLSVTAVSKVQTHLRQESVSPTSPSRPKSSKLEIFRAMENCTTREVDQKLAEARGEKLRTKLVLELDEELEGLWTQVKHLAAHRVKGREDEVLRMLAREWLTRNDPQREVRPQSGAGTAGSDPGAGVTGLEVPHSELPRARTEEDETVLNHLPLSATSRRTVPLSTGPASRAQARFIPAALRRRIWRKHEGRCVECKSTYALQIDHILPVALGGKSTEENLRLLCRSCNQHSAIRLFGVHAVRPQRHKN